MSEETVIRVRRPRRTAAVIQQLVGEFVDSGLGQSEFCRGMAKLNPKDQAATRIVKLMNDLFAIDAEACEKNMDHAARHGLRLEKAPALLDEIRAQILAAQKNALPQSATGKATSYTLALWSKLTRFLEYPELELSNNLAENSMRPIAIGRKNWIHIRSPQAGPKVASIQSVVESCRRRYGARLAENQLATTRTARSVSE